MSLHSYTATIGRNIGTMPMTLTMWEQFKGDVQTDMVNTAVHAAVHVESVETHYGKGMWQGIEEESAKITILTSARMDDGALNILRGYLSENARHYGQDAIALTIGESELC